MYKIEQIGAIEVIHLNNGILSASIAINCGCTLYSLRYNNSELIYFPYNLTEYANQTKLAGIPFMHPWANRLNKDVILNQPFDLSEENKTLITRDANNLPLHGLLLKSALWKIAATIDTIEETSVIAMLSFTEREFLQLFPFPHQVEIKISLKGNKIYYTTTLQTLSNKAIPLCFGYHPYFNINTKEDNYLRVPKAKVALVNELLLPTGETKDKEELFSFKEHQLKVANCAIDHCFIHKDANSIYQLITPHYRLQLELDENYKYMQIYHPNHLQKPYICIEPMLAMADALNHIDTLNYTTQPIHQFSFSILID